MEETIAIGRRKTAVSSVRLRVGKGDITVNGRKFDDYFPLDLQRKTILSPLIHFDSHKKFDILIRVKGGGIEAQALATRLGISRALVTDDETKREELKPLGFLRRDPRKKERKKYGRKGARRGFQFSKR